MTRRPTSEPTAEPTRVGILGAAYSANRGAASMLKAVVDNLPDHVGPCAFFVLSTYPEEDRVAYRHPAVQFVSAKPRQMPWLFIGACMTWFGRRLGVAGTPVAGGPGNRVLDRMDIVVDLAGISFVDGRGLPVLAYNVMMTGMPLLLGRPVVKASQAMGPFRTRLNAALAGAVLPKVHTICARGSQTAAHLAELKVGPVAEAADLAFTMRSDPGVEAEADRHVFPSAGAPMVAIVPSEVVNQYCRGAGLDYEGAFANLIRRILDGGNRCVLFPHTVRARRPASRMNDQPLCQAISDRVGDHPGFLLSNEGLPPDVLREMISRCSLLVTSRFHAMISALSVATPVLVVGWSHKYREVLADFDLTDAAIGWEGLNDDKISEAFDKAWDRRADAESRIRQHLGSVVTRSNVNYEVIRSALSDPPGQPSL